MSVINLKRLVLTVAIIGFAIAAVMEGFATEVKYCKDYTTGKIYVVEKNMPCPYPTVEL